MSITVGSAFLLAVLEASFYIKAKTHGSNYINVWEKRKGKRKDNHN
jgi:hypothetical protein